MVRAGCRKHGGCGGGKWEKLRFVQGVGRGRADVPLRGPDLAKIGLGWTTPPISRRSVDEKRVNVASVPIASVLHRFLVRSPFLRSHASRLPSSCKELLFRHLLTFSKAAPNWR